MKKIIYPILISACFIFPIKSIATDSPLAQKEIQHHILLPANGVSENQKIEVLFTLDKRGKVDFVLAKTSDAHLKNSIEKQFLNLILPGLNTEVVNSVILNIKLI